MRSTIYRGKDLPFGLGSPFLLWDKQVFKGKHMNSSNDHAGKSQYGTRPRRRHVLGCLVIVTLILTYYSQKEGLSQIVEHQDLQDNQEIAKLNFKYGQETWKLYLNSSKELTVAYASRSSKGVFLLSPNKGFPKEITRVVAASAESVSINRAYVGLSVESISEDKTTLEYRMILGEYDLAPEQTNSKLRWICSRVLIRQPIDTPFTNMSIALPGGDSLFATYQLLERSRVNDSDKVQTHTFINHCPIVGDGITRHYFCDQMKLEKNSLSPALARAPAIIIVEK